tara:strand:- start:4501 stop:4971 length:471 start_codon:yes stop_codon:yes gene_type:complete
MIDNLIFETFIYYVLQENNFKILSNLRLTCSEYNDNIKNDIYYQRKKNAYLLHNTINKIDMDCNNIWDFVSDKHDFKYMLNNIYNIYTSSDFTYTNYKQSIHSYKYDNLNPLKRLPIFRKNQIKQKMKSSIMLNMALDHAEKQFSFNIAREIDDYY